MSWLKQLSAVVIVLGMSFSGALKLNAESEGTTPGEEIEIRANTEKRHRLDEYSYREETRDDGTGVLGTIHGKVLWEAAKSPYVMEGNVFVAEDGDLTIEPGVEVQVVRLTENTSSIGAYVCLRVSGTLTVEGTADSMIWFTSASDKPDKYREWQGIVIGRNSSMSILKWVLVEDAIFGIDAYGPALIAHCVFRKCHTGIYLEKDFAGDVVHNVSCYNLYSGIRCKGTRAEATIVNNICYENGDGIRGWWDAVAYADYNLYWSSRRGAEARYYSGMEPGKHDVKGNPIFVNPEEGDFRLADNSPAIGAGYGNTDIGLYTRGWNEGFGEQENANWLSDGARRLWYEGLEVEKRDSGAAVEKYKLALKKNIAPDLRDKISCSLGRVLISKAEYSSAKEMLLNVISESEFVHIRDHGRRHLANALALEGKADEALSVVKELEWAQSQVWAKPALAKYTSLAGDDENALSSLEKIKDKEPYRYLKALSEMVSDRLSEGQVDAAVTIMKGFEDYPLAVEVPWAYLSIAKAAREKGRFGLAAELLSTSYKKDPYSKEAPESLLLLAGILDKDVNPREDANGVLGLLCADYYPFNPYVMKGRKRIDVEDPPVSMKILLDTSLGESSIFDRGPFGSNNFGQYEVAGVLAEAGYIVHTNDRRQSGGGSLKARTLTPDVVNLYGLIILNGRYGGSADPPIPQDVIKTLIEYVESGGNLLVVASGKRLGNGKTAKYYNPILQPFGMSFEENVDLPLKSATASDHPAVNGLVGFEHRCGVPVTVENGDVLGYVEEQPMLALSRYGKGKVIAAGLGACFRGGSIGAGQEGATERARNNRELLVRLASYLLSSAEIAKEPI
jgi:tetratricopeptide (TPR) repeat protein